MTQSTIKWHLARDNRIALAKFCENNRIRSNTKLHTYTDDDGREYWQQTSYFDNGGYITAELLHGDKLGYLVADYFQVLDYSLGA